MPIFDVWITPEAFACARAVVAADQAGGAGADIRHEATARGGTAGAEPL